MTKTSSLLLLTLALALAGCPRPLPPDVAANATTAVTLRKALGGTAAAETTAAAVAEPTGWATLKGHFKVNGAVTLAPIKVEKDNNVCGATAPDLSAIVDAEGNLKNVLVFLNNKIPDEGQDKWIHTDYAADAEKKIDFDQKQCIFLSHVLTMRSTQTLNVLNSDPVGHNTKIDPFNYNAIITPGGNDDKAAVKPLKEPAPVSCSIHPWMAAYIMATPHPYIAVTDEKGEFELKNVPAGVELEFKLWHERLKFIGGGTLDGKSASWPKGRMKLTLNDGEERALAVELDAAKF